ncbi:MAG: TolC family protein, partial [Bdellovibrionota bacterium]
MRAGLETMPEKALTIDYVLKIALEKSDGYQIVTAQNKGLDAPINGARAALDPRLHAQAGYAHDGSESISPFNPDSTKSASFGAGATKYFSTGTMLSAELGYGKSTLDYPAGNPLLTDRSAHQAQTRFTVAQNLLKDAFGRTTRLAMDAAETKRNVIKSSVADSVDEWALTLVRIYYGAWMAQSQVSAAQESMARRERLLTIMQTKVNRGTAERPDLLQVQSARLMSEVERDRARERLAETWRTLVTVLKLPESWLAVDATEIPMKEDSLPDRMGQTCVQPASEAKESPLFQAAQFRKSGAEAELRIADLALK